MYPIAFALTMAPDLLIGLAIFGSGDSGIGFERIAQIAPLSVEPTDADGAEPSKTSLDRSTPILALTDSADALEPETLETQTLETNATGNANGPPADVPLI